MTESESRTGDARAPSRGDEDLVELRVLVRRDHLEWLDRVGAADGDSSVGDTARNLLDQAHLDDDVLVARAHAAGFAAVAAELADQYRQDRQADADQIPGEIAALDLAYVKKRCRQARRRVAREEPGRPLGWAPLPTELAPDLAADIEETLMLVAVGETQAVRARRRLESTRGEQQ